MTEPTDPTGPAGGADDERAVRRLLADLPEVHPPEGFFDDLIRTRRRRAWAVAGAGLLAAVVAGALVVAQATGISGDASPPMDDLVDRHESMLAYDVPTLRGHMEGHEVPAPYQAPERLGSLRRGMAVRHNDDVVQVVYAGGGRYLSIFEKAGDMDDAEMADDLTPVDIRGARAWRGADGTLVVRRADVVYVLVGDLDPDDMDDVVADLPDARPMSLTRRIGDAMDDVVDAFGFGFG